MAAAGGRTTQSTPAAATTHHRHRAHVSILPAGRRFVPTKTTTEEKTEPAHTEIPPPRRRTTPRPPRRSSRTEPTPEKEGDQSKSIPPSYLIYREERGREGGWWSGGGGELVEWSGGRQTPTGTCHTAPYRPIHAAAAALQTAKRTQPLSLSVTDRERVRARHGRSCHRRATHSPLHGRPQAFCPSSHPFPLLCLCIIVQHHRA